MPITEAAVSISRMAIHSRPTRLLTMAKASAISSAVVAMTR
jgi:hypothetical protein